MMTDVQRSLVHRLGHVDHLPLRKRKPRPSPSRLAARAEHAVFASQTLTRPTERLSTSGASASSSEPFQPEPWTAAALPVEEATVPPPSWYTSEQFHKLEGEKIFSKYWQYVGARSQLKQAGDYFTGWLNNQAFVVVLGEDMEVKAYHNVCSHRAAAVASGAGCLKEGRFECPYHGWQFDFEGRFRGCRVSHGLHGIKNFSPSESSLHPINVDVWGSLIFLNMSNDPIAPSVSAFMGAAEPDLKEQRLGDDDWVLYKRLEYPMACNWKVMADNYQDGNYHVYLCHPGLIRCLDMDKSLNKLYDNVTIMWGPNRDKAEIPTDPEYQHIIDSRTRGGVDQSYSMLFPNMFYNRYGCWMSTTTVYPLTADTCVTVFDTFFKKEQLDDEEFLAKCMKAENELQLEDVDLCLKVGINLNDPLYNAGRYAPIEAPMWLYHQWVHRAIFGSAPGLVHRPQDAINQAYYSSA